MPKCMQNELFMRSSNFCFMLCVSSTELLAALINNQSNDVKEKELYIYAAMAPEG